MSAWDARLYDRVAMPQQTWGEEVVRRLPPDACAGPAVILDAGCGSGRVTASVLDRFPDATVIAGDVSPSMRERAQQRLARYGDRVRVVPLDVADDAMLAVHDGRLFDAVLSTGTFHWIRDHAAMYRRLAAVLRPGGALVAQYGGDGSVAGVRAIVDDLGIDWRRFNHYAGAQETLGWLRDAGFRDRWAWLAPEPVDLHDREAAVAYLLGGVLAPYVAERPAVEQREIAETVADRLGEPRVLFVRLNVLARRA
ncbi:class I SAM-dependent methyltransferase [Frankia sp. AiPs1]|uniref:class I SAM-dependent methyltransferase n=1 Tax=Frankia sp. AiPs1 TaxID=573493 RepID=UPI002044A74D|nr:class I SAM-dependent methyltransferase [Frankia sp. AiPs1]MCM3921986.1 class I SAM-dependent methyltransferase [Frankia sp. AiPs1]